MTRRARGDSSEAAIYKSFHLEAELRAGNNCPVVVRVQIDAKLRQKVCNAMERIHA